MQTKILLIKYIVFTSLIFIVNYCYAYKLDSIEVYSNAMKKNIKSFIILPNDYQNNNKKYAVVYLLHGYNGSYQSWVKDAPNILKDADLYNLILVCPDGKNSWYINSPVMPEIQYSKYIAKELIPFIDKNYRTFNNEFGRAITGYSMGGHGAFYLALKNPNMFIAAGSICGGMDIKKFKNNWDLTKLLGDSLKQDNWVENTVIDLFKKEKQPNFFIIFDCGLNDFFLDVNRDLHQQLLQQNIVHEYTERPGAHNKQYWKNSIDFQLLFFSKKLLRAN
ncbi:MAG: alpha/beta hydrolase family protein [Sediminibacterium sp.]|nr:alpha/beta hydrolase family protein [Sediminibacterium sp.]